jgi:SAM-dependent methyltransferase
LPSRLEERVVAIRRSILAILPAPMQSGLRAIYRKLRPASRAAAARPVRQIDFPEQVADIDVLREFLLDTDIFGPETAEKEGYVNHAINRFRITMALLANFPARSKVLELGSNPYFITRLMLQRALDVTCANWFGDQEIGAKGVQIVSSPISGARQEFVFDHFNVEVDRFPYPDASFDVVLCCEILEHLPHNPTQLLAEIHRVLQQPAGVLLLTTPNAVRWENLIRMWHGENVYEQLSGYGTYGRHNREYTLSELTTLLEQCGFELIDSFAMDIQPPPDDPVRHQDGRPFAERADNLFALARPRGRPRWPYPNWLYQSQHGYRRVVNPAMEVGYNDDLQSRGLGTREQLHQRYVRWIGKAGTSAFVSDNGADASELVVAGVAAPPEAGDVIVLHAEVEGHHVSWEIPSDGKPFCRVAPIGSGNGEREVQLHTDRTWLCHTGASTDERGVAIARVAIETPTAH